LPRGGYFHAQFSEFRRSELVPTIKANRKDTSNSVTGWKIVALSADGTESMLKAIELLNVSQISAASIVYSKSDRTGSRFKIAVPASADEVRLKNIARKIGQFASVKSIELTLNGQVRDPLAP
jgi:hypothetical protein